MNFYKSRKHVYIAQVFSEIKLQISLHFYKNFLLRPSVENRLHILQRFNLEMERAGVFWCFLFLFIFFRKESKVCTFLQAFSCLLMGQIDPSTNPSPAGLRVAISSIALRDGWLWASAVCFSQTEQLWADFRITRTMQPTTFSKHSLLKWIICFNQGRFKLCWIQTIDAAIFSSPRGRGVLKPGSFEPFEPRMLGHIRIILYLPAVPFVLMRVVLNLWRICPFKESVLRSIDSQWK